MVLFRSLPALLAGALVLIAGCTSAPAIPQPHEYLDEQTGATVTAVDAPLVFARERSERAPNPRDYLSVVASSDNRRGEFVHGPSPQLLEAAGLLHAAPPGPRHTPLPLRRC